jgi:hypothetical protein
MILFDINKPRPVPVNNSVHDKSNESNNNKTSQTSFAQAAGTTDVTLRHSVKDLKNRLLLLN